MATLDVQGLSCSYGDVKVLENVFLRSGKGECIGIIGPNGSGKSTLLKALSKSIKPVSRIYRAPGPGPEVFLAGRAGAEHGGSVTGYAL